MRVCWEAWICIALASVIHEHCGLSKISVEVSVGNEFVSKLNFNNFCFKQPLPPLSLCPNPSSCACGTAHLQCPLRRAVTWSNLKKYVISFRWDYPLNKGAYATEDVYFGRSVCIIIFYQSGFLSASPWFFILPAPIMESWEPLLTAAVRVCGGSARIVPPSNGNLKLTCSLGNVCYLALWKY